MSCLGRYTRPGPYCLGAGGWEDVTWASISDSQSSSQRHWAGHFTASAQFTAPLDANAVRWRRPNSSPAQASPVLFPDSSALRGVGWVCGTLSQEARGHHLPISSG